MVRPVWMFRAALAICAGLASFLASAARAEGYDQVRCESFDGRRTSCGSGIAGSVVLIRQLTDTACTQGVSWGVSNGRIWVDRGCRGIFGVPRAAGLDTPEGEALAHAKACLRNLDHGDMRVMFCSSAIRSGRWTGKSLAALHLGRAAGYFAQKRYQEAIPDFDEAIRLNPNSAQAFYGRGNAYLATRQYVRAIQDFDRAISLAPKDSRAYSNRCAAHAMLGKLERAIADCDRALQLNPNDAQARAFRAKLSR